MSIWSRRVTQQTVRRSVEQGPRLRGCDRTGAHEDRGLNRRTRPAPGSHLRVTAQALLRPPRSVLAATPQGTGRMRAHLFVGDPRNIDILLRALLLDLHPASPPSHTCLVMKQVLDQESWGLKAFSADACGARQDNAGANASSPHADGDGCGGCPP